MADKKKKNKKNNKIKNTLQKAGSITMIPYALNALGFEDAAQTTGYPFDKEGKRRTELEFKNSAENRRKRGEKNIYKHNYEDDIFSLITKKMGFEEGGAVRKNKPKMGCVMKGRGGSYKGRK